MNSALYQFRDEIYSAYEKLNSLTDELLLKDPEFLDERYDDLFDQHELIVSALLKLTNKISLQIIREENP